MTKIISRAGFGAAVLSLLGSGSALAHHPLGGGTPETFMHGFLSGVGHPVIGIDHFAFVVAVGLVAAFAARRFVSPLAFVVATMVGCLLHFGGLMLPMSELLIAVSVLALGAVVLSGKRLSDLTQIAAFSVAGLFHGFAYGGAIIGAEATPLVAYLAAFSLTQFLIAAGVMVLVTAVWRSADVKAIQPRLAGALVAGVGLVFVWENVESILLG